MANHRPIDIWPELLGSHAAFCNPFNRRAVFGWDSAAIQLPLTNRAFGYAKKIRQCLHGADTRNRLIKCFFWGHFIGLVSNISKV